MTSTRSRIFISYSHEDEKALDQHRPFLRPLERRGLIDFWDDTRLEGGATGPPTSSNESSTCGWSVPLLPELAE